MFKIMTERRYHELRRNVEPSVSTLRQVLRSESEKMHVFIKRDDLAVVLLALGQLFDVLDEEEGTPDKVG